MIWQLIPAKPNCDHEVDLDGPTDNFDMDDMAKYRAAGFHCRCKHCGGAGHCVDDTGNFWRDGDGYYV